MVYDHLSFFYLLDNLNQIGISDKIIGFNKLCICLHWNYSTLKGLLIHPFAVLIICQIIMLIDWLFLIDWWSLLCPSKIGRVYQPADWREVHQFGWKKRKRETQNFGAVIVPIIGFWRINSMTWQLLLISILEEKPGLRWLKDKILLTTLSFITLTNQKLVVCWTNTISEKQRTKSQDTLTPKMDSIVQLKRESSKEWVLMR